MNTKSIARIGLFVLCASSAPVTHADLLADPLGPLPKDVSRAAKTGVQATAAPANNAKPTPAPAAATPTPTPTPTPVQSAMPASAPVPAPPASSAAAPAAPAPRTTASTQPSAPVASNSAALERATHTGTSLATFRELDQLRTQKALLTDMVAVAEMRAKLANPGAAPGSSASSGALRPSENRMLSVDGVDDEITAVISLVNGTTLKVREGSPIPGMGKVKSITLDRVLVSTKDGQVAIERAPVSTYPGAR